MLKRAGRDLTLRAATSDDFGFASELWKLCHRPWVEPIWGWEESHQDKWFAEQWSIANRSIVERNGRPIGSLTVLHRSDHLFVEDIEVHPSNQRKGLGTQLMEAVLAQADKERLAVGLRVLHGNPAIRLYRRLGFVETRQTEHHIEMERPAAVVGNPTAT